MAKKSNIPAYLSATELDDPIYADMKLMTVINAAHSELAFLVDPFPTEVITLAGVPTGELNWTSFNYAKKNYAKLKSRWGRWGTDFSASDSAKFASNMAGTFEHLSHWYPIGTGFQHAFTDPIFRVLESGNITNDIETVTIANFQLHFDAFVGSIKAHPHGGVFYHRIRMFVKCLFATKKDEKGGFTDTDFKKCLSDIKMLNNVPQTTTDLTSFMQFHFLVLYYIAYKALTIDDLDRYVYRSFHRA